MPNNNIVKMDDFLFNKLGEVVSDDDAMDILKNNFNNIPLAYTNFERMIYEMAEQMSIEYKGASWLYVQCKEDNGFFMYPSSGEFSISNNNFNSEHIVDNRTFGLLVTMMTLSHGSFAFQNHEEICGLFGNNYHKLRGGFFKLIDKFCYGEEDENGEPMERSADFIVNDEQLGKLRKIASAVYNYLD